VKNQRGQMTIFIALIFQVLFVFFAMIINVGLIVHDKINLQNSVDLAAYYGAQRQAEVLNAIAHQNYEIRQAWKLLAWRVHVIGDLGNRANPMGDGKTFTYPDAPITRDANTPYPVVCVAHSFWGSGQENICYDATIHIPAFPKFQVIMPLLPENITAQITGKGLEELATKHCEMAAPLNFNMAVRWMQAYRAQIGRAKESILAYANNLSAKDDDITDVSGQSTNQGVQNTLKNNLTRENALSLGEVKFFNSLGVGDSKKWLHDVPLYPAIFYANIHQVGSGCSGNAEPISGSIVPPGFESQAITAIRQETSDVTNPYHSSFGYEKNPWMMAYVGVYAETKPHKPYLPFGTEIVLKARAYAKPFGGRIGPWYFTQWPSNSDHSQGTQRIDGQMPYPLEEGADTPDQKLLSIPNYSRYPGDSLGLNSAAAIALFKEQIYDLKDAGAKMNPLYYSLTPNGDDGLAMADPQSTAGQMSNMPVLNYQAPWIRAFEVAAVAPDLFDATYYSIDPEAYYNYTKAGVGKIFAPGTIPYDIGSLVSAGEAGVRSVHEQIKLATQKMSSNAQMNFYIIKDVTHLLNSWAPSSAFKYDFPSAVFGRCKQEMDNVTTQKTGIPVPGSCPQGGRTGYSVKIISEQYLKSSDLELGGQGIKGKIANPPPF
jgi:hypothetical protein